MVTRFLYWVVSSLVVLGLLFGTAGRFDLPMFWAYAAVLAVLTLIHAFTVDPGLARERLRPGPGGKDCAFPLIASVLFLAELVVAGLDAGRFHWSDTVPPALQVIALAVVAASFGMVFWASSVNRFFSPVVRIQTERGHRLVMDGPYRYARHPGYAGMILGALCSAVALDSWWSLLPAAAYGLGVLHRARFEDLFLKQNLPGYREYAERVRYRLLPGLW
ncbi:MAG: isoprenylcysteine carboxylmethyltransferase family protein [Acidobacteria bacterium]|nr:isoprenylcysteine carboxylmethyltransferase family protein [Acidobacteriota bacterium]